MAKAEYKSSLRSKKLITDALVKLLDEKPLDKITVTDIVKKADINRGTFYSHYDNVSEVINSIFSNAFDVLKQSIYESNPFQGQTPCSMFHALQTVVEQDLDFYQKIFSSDKNMQIYEQIINIWMSYVLEHEESLSDMSHEDYIFYTSFYSGGILKLYRDWFAGTLPISFDELTSRATALLEELQTNVQKTGLSNDSP